MTPPKKCVPLFPSMKCSQNPFIVSGFVSGSFSSLNPFDLSSYFYLFGSSLDLVFSMLCHQSASPATAWPPHPCACFVFELIKYQSKCDILVKNIDLLLNILWFCDTAKLSLLIAQSLLCPVTCICCPYFVYFAYLLSLFVHVRLVQKIQLCPDHHLNLIMSRSVPVCPRLCRSVLVCIGLSWSVLVWISQSQSFGVCPGLFRSVLVCIGLSWSVLVCVSQSLSVSVSLGQSRSVPVSLGLSWSLLVCSR